MRGDEVYIPPHRIKDSGIKLRPGDLVRLYTPGGGGYGDALKRDPALVAEDVRKGVHRPGDGARCVRGGV